MIPELDVKTEKREVVVAFLQKLNRHIKEDMRRPLMRAAQFVIGNIRRSIKLWLNESSFTGKRTGQLERSFHPDVVQDKEGRVTVGVYSRLEYARIHEEGGVIRPKEKRNLAVPFPNARVTIGKWPRHYGKGELVLIIRGHGKAPLLAKVHQQVVSARGKVRSGEMLEPLFMLLPFVRIRPKRYVTRAAEMSKEGVEKLLGDHYETVVRTL